MDRPGVRQVPEGSGEHGKIEKTGCKIICPTTLMVKGLMMMLMMNSEGVGLESNYQICCNFTSHLFRLSRAVVRLQFFFFSFVAFCLLFFECILTSIFMLVNL